MPGNVLRDKSCVIMISNVLTHIRYLLGMILKGYGMGSSILLEVELVCQKEELPQQELGMKVLSVWVIGILISFHPVQQ